MQRATPKTLSLSLKTNMNAKELAGLLNGREYGTELSHAEEVLASNDGLVVVYGRSDDNMELR